MSVKYFVTPQILLRPEKFVLNIKQTQKSCPLQMYLPLQILKPSYVSATLQI